MEAPEKIWMDSEWVRHFDDKDFMDENSVEYTRTDAFIERVISFLNYKLDDVVATRVAGTIRPHHVAKQELIEDLQKYLKG